MMKSENRQVSAIDGIVDGFLAEYAELDPILATRLGLPGARNPTTRFLPERECRDLRAAAAKCLSS